jgi:hypothetical protein
LRRFLSRLLRVRPGPIPVQSSQARGDKLGVAAQPPAQAARHHYGRFVPARRVLTEVPGGGGTEQLVLETSGDQRPTDWSPDGRFLLFDTLDRSTCSAGVWALRWSDRTSNPVVRTKSKALWGQFSPDSNWVAYQSDESGRDEIHVQPFSGSGQKSQVSSSGGTQVRGTPSVSTRSHCVWTTVANRTDAQVMAPRAVAMRRMRL